MKKTTFIVIALLFGAFTFAQKSAKYDYVNASKKSGANFYKIKETKRNEFKNLDLSDLSNKKASKQFGRWETYWQNKVDANGNFDMSTSEDNLRNLPANTLLTSIFDNNQQERTQNSTSSASWTQVGPVSSVLPHGYTAYPGMGLVNVVKTIGTTGKALAGTSNGGIWLTNDINVTNPVWTPKTDELARLGIVDIKVDPNNNNTVYALTGDRDSFTRSKSIGVIKSTDGGNTWATTAAVIDPTTVTGISNLGVDPTDSNKQIFWVNANGSNSIYLTTDGWATFTLSSELNIQYGNDIVYTSNFILISDIFGRIYKSTDGGVTFINIYNNDENATNGNIVLRFNQETTANGDIYFLAAKKNDAKVYKLTTAEITAATTVISATQVGQTLSSYEPQGTYNVAFCVNPNNTNHIWVLGVNGFFTKDGGSTWVRVLDAYYSQSTGQTYVHPDFHYVSYIDNNNYWVTHDGGTHKVNTDPFINSDAAVTVEDKTSNLIIGQIYHIAIVPNQNGFTDVTVALQDNDGFSKAPNTQSGQWVSVLAGDGTGTAINYNNPLIRFMGGTNGQLARTTTAYQGAYNDQTAVIARDDNAPFVCEVLIHDSNPDVVIAEHTNLKYSQDKGETFNDNPNYAGTITDIDQAVNKIAVVGPNISKIGTINSLGNFGTPVTLMLPTGISAFYSVGLNTTSHVYGTVGGYDATNKVFKHTNNAQSLAWENITFNLPNVAIEQIISKKTNLGSYDEILFVATEIGVYYKLGSTSTNWEKLGTGLPNVTVKDMKINYATDKLYAGTFGRGLWEVSVAVNTLATNDIQNNESNIAVYPNPIQKGNDLKIKLPNEFIGKEVSYRMFNFMGGIVKQGSVDNNTINSVNLMGGIYILEFTIENQTYTHKIVVK